LQESKIGNRMKPLTLHQIRQAVGGKALSRIPQTAPMVSSICTDTRRMEPGSLFVALKGDRFNGHNYIPDAAKGGAVGALVEEAPPAPQPNVHLIQVPDARAAMGQLARYVRKHMRSRIIAVAGSNGKTSTKHLIHAALCGKLRGSISPKSYNNDIGVPLTIFPADPMQDYLVLEMGTNHHGEIKVLADMALPDVAVITNCSAEHLEGLEDLMGVRRENASIIHGLNPKGLLVVNGDDDELLEAVGEYSGRRVTFGLKPTNDLFATDIDCTDTGVSFRLNDSRRRVFVPMLGRHTALNALAAIAVARRLGVDGELVYESLAEAEGPEMRLQLQRVGGVSLLNDAYNANPASMRAALETVCSLSTSGRRIAVVGDMRELGKSSERFHKEIGEFAATLALDALVCVGEKAALIAEVAEQRGMPSGVISRYGDAAAAAKAVPTLLHAGDLVLLKGSRSVHLEYIAQAMAEYQPKLVRKAAS
jgi:UDP-N-acetylmuramoyl-tripeptide--D-alanyl-D-alanine ligase